MRIAVMNRIAIAPRPWLWLAAWALASPPSQALPAAPPSARLAAGSPRSLEMVNGPVHALLEVEASALVVGGSFDDAYGVPVSNIARFDGQGWSALGDGLDGTVRALALLNGNVVAGGDFTHSGTIVVNHLAKWNGSAWEPLGSGTDGTVNALLVQANVILYVGGDFGTAGGVEAHSVAQWIVSWNPVGMGLDGIVHDLELFNGSLIAGGEFTMRDPGSPGQNLARFTSGVWRSPALGLDGPVFALTTYNGALVMAGDFSNADTVTPVRNIASLISDWQSVGFGIGPGDSTDTSVVRALQVVGNDLVAGGDFDLADLELASHVARFDGTAWHALGAGTNETVRALTPHGGRVVAGGDFTEAGGMPIDHVAEFTGQAWQPLLVDPVWVEDLAAEIAGESEVWLRWRLAAPAVTSLTGVVVQRAPAAAGPWSDRDPVPVAPARDMQFREGFDAKEPWYRLLVIDRNDGATVVGPIEVRSTGRSNGLVLHAVRDLGPGNPIIVEYELAHSARVQLDLYDARGRLVRELAAGTAAPGRYLRTWDRRDAQGRDAARGVYILQLSADGRVATRKLVVARR